VGNLDRDAFFHLFTALSVMAAAVVAYSVWRAIRDARRAKQKQMRPRRRRW
jgi:threonine/homoserine/homoserine lactone efflux protein